jgi:glycerophosphoryl diester phosphodiesterase
MRLNTIILLLIIVCSCNKIEYFPDKSYSNNTITILSHHGGADAYPANTIEAAIYGLSVLKGIEVDIQISKDNTIWMSHNAQIVGCDGQNEGCFTQLSDNYLETIDSCNTATVFSKLEDVFSYMNKNCPEKIISIDVKAWEPCDIYEINVIDNLNVIGDKIIDLTNKYGLNNHVMVESETATFLTHVKNKNAGVDCYLTTLGDFERGMVMALQKGYTGISFQYNIDEIITPEYVALLHRKGLKIHLWTIDSETDFKDAINIHPDFIQTNNIKYASTLKL